MCEKMHKLKTAMPSADDLPQWRAKHHHMSPRAPPPAPEPMFIPDPVVPAFVIAPAGEPPPRRPRTQPSNTIVQGDYVVGDFQSAARYHETFSGGAFDRSDLAASIPHSNGERHRSAAANVGVLGAGARAIGNAANALFNASAARVQRSLIESSDDDSDEDLVSRAPVRNARREAVDRRGYSSYVGGAHALSPPRATPVSPISSSGFAITFSDSNPSAASTNEAVVPMLQATASAHQLARGWGKQPQNGPLQDDDLHPTRPPNADTPTSSVLRLPEAGFDSPSSPPTPGHGVCMKESALCFLPSICVHTQTHQYI